MLTKGRETLDTGMTVVVTSYGIAREHGVDDLGGKKTANKVLAKQMLDYMKQKGQFPPGTEIKKVFKNGSVDVRYEASDFDKFSIRLTPELVGGNVEDFLDSLETAGRRKFNPTDEWKIELAKSGRAQCRTCGSSIAKNALRVGEPTYFQDHLNYKWHHFTCISDTIWGIPQEKLTGYANLSEEQKKELTRALWE